VSETRPNFILLSVDALRFDALSAETDKRYLKRYSVDSLPRTPVLDRFAHEGVHFSGCRVVATYTPQSHASILTGLYPYRHGVRMYVQTPILPGVDNLFQRFERAGYSALASVDFNAIFDHSGLLEGATKISSHDDSALIDRLRSDQRQGKPFLLFSHMGDVHDVYGARKNSEFVHNHETYLKLAQRLGIKLNKGARALVMKELVRLEELAKKTFQIAAQQERGVELGLPIYLSGVNQFDERRFSQFVESLEENGLLENTWFVITADHGEGATEVNYWPVKARLKHENGFQHGYHISDETLRVPLIFWKKGLSASRGRNSRAAVSSVDIAPTLLSLAGLSYGARDVDGIDRSQFVLGIDSSEEESDCYAEHWFHSPALWKRLNRLMNFSQEDFERVFLENKVPPLQKELILNQQSVRKGRYKLLQDHLSGTVLLDTENEPWERTNLLKMSALKGLPWVEELPDFEKIAADLLRRMRAMQTDGKKISHKIRLKSPKARPTQDKKGLREMLESMKRLGYF
jgi:hypothetical protein